MSCGQEVGRIGPVGPWMCRILRPTSCPLLYPQTHLNWWLIPRGCKNVFEYQLYSGERVEERPLAHRGSAQAQGATGGIPSRPSFRRPRVNKALPRWDTALTGRGTSRHASRSATFQ